MNVNWKYIVIGIGVVAIVGGAGLYWFSNNEKPTRLPETYEECLSTVRDFSSLGDPELKCLFSVTIANREVYKGCEDTGGMLLHGDPASRPEQYVCRLEYYNPDYTFPATYDECIRGKKGVDMSTFTDLKICLISLTLGNAYNKEVARQLIEDCKGRNPIASSQEFCTIRIER